MLVKNTRASVAAVVAAVVAALLTGLLVTLWLALMPAPAQAQSGDSLQLIGISAIRTEDWWPDDHDEPMIKIDGIQWGTVLSMKAGDYRDLTDREPKVFSGANPNNAKVQLYEVGPGDTLLGGFVAEYTDGKERTETINFNNGQATYEITYVVNRSSSPNTSPEILDLSPTPGSSTQNRTPLISATVRDAETDLSASNIKLFVDGNAKTFPYDQGSDKLSYQSAELAAGQHTVRIEATDEKGLQTIKDWTFTVENAPPPSLQCSDGQDNDGDGKIDFGTGPNNDPGCESATDNTESPDPPNTAPTIVPTAPAPGSKINNRAPLISATVRDAETDLDGTTIKLFVDGIEKTASYDKASDKLSYQSAKLTAGQQHMVKIEATDASGLKGQNTWMFKVVKRH